MSSASTTNKGQRVEAKVGQRVTAVRDNDEHVDGSIVETGEHGVWVRDDQGRVFGCSWVDAMVRLAKPGQTVPEVLA